MANPNLLALIAAGGPAGPNDNFSKSVARGQAINEARDASARKNELLNAFPAAIKGDPNALEAVGRADPQAYMGIQEHQMKAQEAQRKQLEARVQQYAGASLYALDQVEKAPEANRQAAYQQLLPSVAQIDPELFKAMGPPPAQYDPMWAHQARARLLPLALGDKFNDFLAKGQEGGFTLSPGEKRYGPGGNVIATAPPKADPSTTAFEPVAPGGADVNGEDFLKTLNPQTAAQVKALAEGRMAFPSGFALKSDYWQKMLGAVAKYDPSFDAVNYNKRAQTAAAFSKGKQGDALRAVNQTIAHMGSLSDAIDKLDNMGGMATSLNAVANFAAEQTGDSRPGVFRQKAQAVSSELRKVFAASGGGGLAELEQWEKSLPANASRDQQHAYLKSGLELLQGAIDALDNQYQSGMGKSIMDSSLISDKSRKVMAKLRGPAEAATTPTSTAPAKITSDADYDALKSGDEFIAPDGSHRRKP